MHLNVNTDHKPKEIIFLAYEQALSLDITGPLEVFDTANWCLTGDSGRAKNFYQTGILAAHAQPIRLSSGLRILADRLFDNPGNIPDTLIIPGGAGAMDASGDEKLVGLVSDLAGKVRRLASVCTGTFILARAGLLSNRRATTHWLRSAQLRREFPDIKVEPDSIYVKDGHIYSSAGVTAGIDLALAMVEEDHSAELAYEVARILVLNYRRAGSQAQYSASLAAQTQASDEFKDLVHWIMENMAENLTVERLAEQAQMSPRHFARVFAQKTSTTPARFVELVRLDEARGLLETTALDLGKVADQTGFGSAAGMRRAFVKIMGISPRRYRNRFGRPQSGRTEMGGYR